ARQEGIRPNVVTLTAVIHAAASQGDSESALRWYRSAASLNMKPNTVTHAALLHALRRNASAAEFYFRVGVEQDGIEPNAVTYNTLIDALARSGQMERAGAYFAEMLTKFRPDAATFGAMVNGAAEQGNVEAAKSWLEFMERSGVPSNLISWNALLKACARAVPPRCDAAEELFVFMVNARNLQPDRATLTTLGSILGMDRARKISESLGLSFEQILHTRLDRREAKRKDLHSQLSEQFRRLSRLPLAVSVAPRALPPLLRAALAQGKPEGAGAGDRGASSLSDLDDGSE
ncbi:unnamed protein product, partial [Polarella glacialis]